MTTGTVLPKGEHVFKFKFQIPSGDLPSSFNSSCGQITYMLEAKICRSWRFPLKEQKQLRFTSISSQIPLQCPVSGSVRKGKVEMSATVDKKVCCPGDILSVVANICNSFSSKAVRPKFQLIKREIYRAEGSTTSSNLSHGKVVGKYIAANSKETVSCQLRVPVDAVDSIHNCEILTVEYYVKAYVDISFAIDPEIELPVVVIPARFASQMHDETMGTDFASHFPAPDFPAGPYPVPAGLGAPFQPGQAVLPYPVGAVGAPGYSDFPPQGPSCAPTVQGAYGYQARAPTQHAPSTSGFNNQWSQQVPPDGDPLAVFHPKAPTAQPQQGQNPPNYMSLFPSPT
ncbi:arrestin domain-containing protein 3-like isoform X2 [Cheilinus undulatus]|uniref:arrestin domain-containing protein 3-like isoform X2 n=1 Tax=Cheilinus undulatus TaxID=241271 RepID=UPI001BD6DFBD|nr:arrestin domain-containing protein 3-like isoform X2 [Cheilinus undulatus]XP_041644430.1 arrestin domain-containing protein 3-like isoform X2 [Cheilinus undulatus]